MLLLTARSSAEWALACHEDAQTRNQTTAYHGDHGRLPGWEPRTIAALALVLRVPSKLNDQVHTQAIAVRREFGRLRGAFDLTPPDSLHFPLGSLGLWDPHRGEESRSLLSHTITGLARVTETLNPFSMQARGLVAVSDAVLLRGFGPRLSAFAAMKAAIWEAHVPRLAGEGDSPYVHPAQTVDGKRGFAAQCTVGVFRDDTIAMADVLGALRRKGGRIKPDVAWRASRLDIVACVHDGGAPRLLPDRIATFALGQGLTSTAEPQLSAITW